MKNCLTVVAIATLLGSPWAVRPVQAQPAETVPAVETSHYVSEQFGIEFDYPKDYVVTVDAANSAIALFHGEDVGMPEIPYVYIGFFENSEQLSLQTFRDDTLGMGVIREYDDTTVAGQPALDFDATGYYESRNQIFDSPDGRYIVYFSSSYVGDSASEPFLEVANVIQDSWTWR